MSFVGGVGYSNIDLIYSGLDRLPDKGEEIFARGFSMQFGGGIPATMINLSRLGVESRIITFAGHDLFSEFVKKTLNSYPVKTVNLYKGNKMPVVLSSTLLYCGDRSFISYTDGMDLNDAVMDEVYENLKGAYVVDMHVGFLDVYKRLKKDGCIQILDTGWEDDLTLEKYRDYLEIADYYIPNQKEAMKITGTSSVEAAADVLSEFFSDVTIKMDKEGCLLKNKDGIKIISSVQNVKAIDATGAGDAFMSGFIYGLYHHHSIEQCIKFGNVTGSACVQGMGCISNFVNEEQLLEIAETLEVREL